MSMCLIDNVLLFMANSRTFLFTMKTNQQDISRDFFFVSILGVKPDLSLKNSLQVHAWNTDWLQHAFSCVYALLLLSLLLLL